MVMDEKTSKAKLYGATNLAYKNHKSTYQGSNEDIFADIIALAHVLYTRLEAPGNSLKVCGVTGSIPQRNNLRNLQDDLREIYYKTMDKFQFEKEEKRIAWLMLQAHTIKDCAQKTCKSVSNIRYTLRRMCDKLECDSKDEMLKRIIRESDSERI